MAEHQPEQEHMLVGREHAADRLMQGQKLRRGSPYLMGEEPPTPMQVSAVLHALADHTLIENMLHHARDLGEDRAHLGDSWALTSGVGRYLQRMGGWLERPLASPVEISPSDAP